MTNRQRSNLHERFSYHLVYGDGEAMFSEKQAVEYFARALLKSNKPFLIVALDGSGRQWSRLPIGDK